MEFFRARFAKIEFEPTRRVAQAILDRGIEGFSSWRDADGSEYSWVTFGSGILATHLTEPSAFSPEFEERFPLDRVEGLREFIDCFGGMALGQIPPGSCYYRAAEAHVACLEDEPRWGHTGEWEGSLVLFHGTSGDLIVVREDGEFAVWHMPFGAMWEDDDPYSEDPFCRTPEGGFPKLMNELLDYCLLPEAELEKSDNFLYWT